MTKNYGLNIAKEVNDQDGSEYMLGSVGRECLAKIPLALVDHFMPQGELQNIGEDKMDCASRAPLNILEAKFNWLYRQEIMPAGDRAWFEQKGYVTERGFEFSDAFIAILSGTTREGNSLKAPLQAIHEHGLVPKKLLPQMATWDEHHDPARVTEEIKALGKEFLARFNLNYEKVYDFSIDDMLDVAGHAWPQPLNGEYPRTDAPFNHAFMRMYPAHFAFDNYIDHDGDFVKKLAQDFKFLGYGYRIIVSRNLDRAVAPISKGFWSRVSAFIKKLLKK